MSSYEDSVIAMWTDHNGKISTGFGVILQYQNSAKNVLWFLNYFSSTFMSKRNHFELSGDWGGRG
jgi:hypothetical protein